MYPLGYLASVEVNRLNPTKEHLHSYHEMYKLLHDVLQDLSFPNAAMLQIPRQLTLDYFHMRNPYQLKSHLMRSG